MGSLTKADLAEDLFNVFGISKSEAKDFVNHFFELIKTSLENGEQVKISGFGNFTLRDKKQRMGRNPKTGKDAVIKPRRTISFHASQKFRKRIVDNNET